MRVESGGAGIEYEVTGEGRPVVLLHGFPDSGRLWRHQIAPLADAGFQVIVPDMRGYGGSDKPTEVDAYNILYLVADVGAVLDEVGVERAHVVGHDWGAAVAWVMAAVAPDRVDHLVALSVGHPSSFRAGGYEQHEKSWYMLLFQFPGIAEQWLSNDGWANFRDWGGHPDADAVIAELEANQSLTPGLNWYRANIPPESYISPPLSLPLIAAPTMGVWSSGDIALTEGQMTRSASHVAGPWRYERLEGPGHWMQLEAPTDVNHLLLDFLPV
jgi:pimeloyl-ACP methyl ester carboxylesterase